MGWNETLHADLVVAVANVLERHGLHPPDSNEDEWWTVDQVGDFASFMRMQVDDIVSRNPRD
jgi:hypothetical protein